MHSINHRNGIDMDRIDYLLRDSYYVIMRVSCHVDWYKDSGELRENHSECLHSSGER